MLRVLLVEDDDALRHALDEALESWYQVESVGAAQHALALLGTGDPPPDVVVLDLMMPGMSGEDFLKEYRARGYTTPVILISASFTRQHTWQQIGAAEYLQKPFFIGELVERVKKVTRKKGPGGNPMLDTGDLGGGRDPDDSSDARSGRAATRRQLLS